MKKSIVVALVMISLGVTVQSMAQEDDVPTAFRSGDVTTLPRAGVRGAISVTPINPGRADKETKTCIIPTSTEMVVVAVNDKDLLLTIVVDLRGGDRCNRCDLFYMPISFFKHITLKERQAEERRKRLDTEVRSLVRENGGTIRSDFTSPFSDCIF